jgi:hypothetical protein
MFPQLEGSELMHHLLGLRTKADRPTTRTTLRMPKQSLKLPDKRAMLVPTFRDKKRPLP